MSTPAIPTSETPLQRERRLFRELFNRLGNALLNRLFDLRPDRAARRSQYLTILFFLTGFIITLQYYPLSVWGQQLQEVFRYLIDQNYVQSGPVDPISAFALFLYQVALDPNILQYLPILLAPFFIALHAAALYLADIFELEEVEVAREFIWDVALTGGSKTIRVSKGEVPEEYQETPTFLIGGPGRVTVDLDSVALFEKSDGTPHVIGPTGGLPGGKATLDGFERFRQAIDIRDHYTDLSVTSRSRDGMPINATDVRLMFSLYRGENPKPSAETPYPIDEKAIEKIFYSATSKVTPEKVNPSTYNFEWTGNMIGLIRGELGGFMSRHNLSVYLASIGMPEIEKIKQREESIAEQIRKLTQTEDEKSKAKDEKPAPEFQPRHKITNLFTQFANEFTKKARDRGVELHWIGVGTWEPPIEMIPEKHLEAWKISQENMGSDSPGAMKSAEDKARLEQLILLINDVPIDAYHNITDGFNKHSKKTNKKQDTKPKHQKKEDEWGDDYLDDDILFGEESDDPDEEMLRRISIIRKIQQERKEREEAEHYNDADQKEIIQLLLLEYRKQFIEAADFIKDKKEAVPQNILDAVQHIEVQLNIKHWVGR